MPYPLWLYIVGWLFFLYLFIQILSFSAQNPGNILLSGLYLVEFGVHEVSHLAVFFLPAIFVAAAGSIGEILFTLLVLFATIKGKAYFATVFASLWVMLAFRSVGLYITDARAQVIPLIGPGETVQHDWNFVLGQLGWLQYDTLLGAIVIWVGTIIGLAGLIFGIYLIIVKIYLKRKSASIKT